MYVFLGVYEEPTRFVIAVITRFSNGAVRPSVKPDKASGAPVPLNAKERTAGPEGRPMAGDGALQLPAASAARTSGAAMLRVQLRSGPRLASCWAVLRPPSPPIWRRERDRRRWSFRAHLASVQVSLWAPQGGRARSLPPKSSEHRIPNPFSPLQSPAPHSFPVLIGLPVFPPSNVLINLARSWFRLLVCTDLTGAGTQPGSESGQGRDLPRAGWGRPRLALDAAGCKTGPEPGL